jgi:hypothetical protein
MKRDIAVGWIAVLALVLIARPLTAQTTVQGAVIVQSGPDTGDLANRATKVLGPNPKVIVHERDVIVVKRVYPRHGGWRKHKYRRVVVYYDGHRYYRRHFHRPGLRRVIVYERGGRYYIDEDHWKRKHRHRGHDRDDDRHEDDD